MNRNEYTCESLTELICRENPDLQRRFNRSKSIKTFVGQYRKHMMKMLREHPQAYAYYKGEERGEKPFYKLSWKDQAIIRILDYLNNEGSSFPDPNLQGQKVTSRPFDILRRAVKDGVFEGNVDMYEDMLHLFRQLQGLEKRKIPRKDSVTVWMDRHPSGLDSMIVNLRQQNKERIIGLLQKKITKISRTKKRGKFLFAASLTEEEKTKQLEQWWNDDMFHLHYAVRNIEELQEMLNHTLDDHTLEIMRKAEEKHIPIFVTPYFLSLLIPNPPEQFAFADTAIRQYVLYSSELVEEFGQIRAWEKEDLIEPGKPNAAGWLLPSNSVHRRYPNVAIFIPSTMGRACGGLCAYCQRMYDFQNGRFNFDLKKLKPAKNWPEELDRLMKYFEEDPQLQDILITGGDAMMSSTASLKSILDAVYEMAKRKQRANKKRPDGEKFAEIVRVRLGTKIPIYLPQRISQKRVEILSEFKKKASKIGIKQFVIQTHFSTAMEITPEAAEAVRKLIGAGWTVTNQQVFIVPVSLRGHTAKLRKVLNDIGVLPYYTFTVKGFRENSALFSVNARSIQEQVEEKSIGRVDPKYYSEIRKFSKYAEGMVSQISSIREGAGIPFIATDRNTINLPGVGKSNTFRTIGITEDGRRILSFEQDHSRLHSPVVDHMEEVIIIESKSLRAYLEQLEKLGEQSSEYSTIWGYSLGYIETRIPVFDYPGYPFKATRKFRNVAEGEPCCEGK